MNAIQLEFNLDCENKEDLKFSQMQKQINEMNDSMGKVRRKIFNEVGELKKLVYELKRENEELKVEVKRLRNEKTEWLYAQGDYLFDVRKNEKVAG